MAKYYHKRCNTTFEREWGYLLNTKVCPQCNNKFGDKINKYICPHPDCNSLFYTDMKYIWGCIYECPFCHKKFFKKLDIKRLLRKIIFIGMAGGIVYVFIHIINWAVAMITKAILTVQRTVFNILDAINNWITTLQNEITNFVVTIQNEIPLAIADSIEIFKFLSIVIFFLVFFMIFLYNIAIRLTRPIDELDAIANTRTPSRFYEKINNIPEGSPDLVFKDVVRKNKKVKINQHRIIAFLVICIATLGLYCYLSKNTSSSPSEIAKTTIHLGLANTVICVIGFYGAKRFSELDKKFMHNRTRLRGLVLSVAFGIATVITMIFLPPILKKPLSGPVIAIELFLNVVVDCFVTTYENIVDFIWKSPKDIYKEIINFLRDKIQQARIALMKYLEKIFAFTLETMSKIISKLTNRN